MKFCSIPGCPGSITESQAETTQKLFGKAVCVAHQKIAAAEASAHDKDFTIDTAPYIKCGFKIENGLAVKIVGQVEVTVDIGKVSQGKPKKECVQVGGYEYVHGQNPDVDGEFKSLYIGLGLINKNGTEKPAKTQTPAAAQLKEHLPARQPPDRQNMPAVKEDTPLSVDTILKYINPKATQEEAFMFLQLCKFRDLNPFLKEAYLVKYGDSPATMIVGKDAFTRKAEESGNCDGWEAGIIVRLSDKTIEYREGVVLFEGEILLGGWAKAYRKHTLKPFHIRVSMQEYDKKKNNWLTMPATMVRKVALVQALREAFTKELGGCYDAAEIDAQGVTQ